MKTPANRPSGARRPRSWILACLAPLGVALGLAGCAGDEPKEVGYDIPTVAEDDDKDLFSLAPDRPPSAGTLRSLARILESQGKTEQAQYVLMRIIREYSDYTPAYSELAELYLRSGRADDAIETLELGIKLAPQDPVLHNNAGMCWLMVGEYEKALSSFTESAALVPEDGRYRSNMATALGMLGRYDEAVDLYEQVIPPPDAHFNLAVVCQAAGDEERAKVEFAVAERLREDSDYLNAHQHGKPTPEPQ